LAISAADNRSITPDVRPVVAELDQFVTRAEVVAAFRRAKGEGEIRLSQGPDLAVAAVPVDPVKIGWTRPAVIASIRVVVMRNPGNALIERHSNAIQYVFALDGAMETYVESKGGWRLDCYGRGDTADLEDRWHVVPRGLWHMSDAPGRRYWACVGLHSASPVNDEYKPIYSDPTPIVPSISID